MFKTKQIKPVAKLPPEPRILEEINKEYSQVCMRLGDFSVKMEEFQGAIQSCKNRIAEIRNELSAREALDQAAKAKEAKPEESKDVEKV